MNTLELEYQLAENNRLQLKYRVCYANAGSNADAWGLRANVGDIEEARNLSRKCRSELLRAFQAMATDADRLDLAAASGHVERLKSFGSELRQALLPGDVIRLLADPHASISHIVFRHDPSLSNIAFDHIVLGDEAHDNDFIVFRYGVGRDVLTEHSAGVSNAPAGSTKAYQGFGLIDPGSLLAREGVESLAVEAWDFLESWSHSDKIEFQQTRVGRPVDGDWVRQAVQQGDIGTIVSHFRFDREHPERSGFVLGPDEVYSAGDLVKDLARGTAPLRVLLAVGCESGSTDGWDTQWIGDTRVWGMVDAVRRAGVRHYIGTSVPFPAAAAGRLLSPFHEGLVNGKTIGHVLRDTRERLREGSPGGALLGLAFLLYGSPQTAYFCAEGHRVSPGTTRCCTGHLKDGSLCGRIVCPQEPGFNNVDALGLLQPRCRGHFNPPQAIRCSAGHVVDNASCLAECTMEGCRNTVCPICSGHGQGLCWEHVCHDDGHRIIGQARKRCLDPHGLHPDEKRSVCPSDDGWMDGLCKECLTHRASQAQDDRAVCPHCGQYVDDESGWAGECVDCGDRLCASCGPSRYEKTMYCPNTTRSRDERDAGWLTSLEHRSRNDAALAAPARLREIHALADEFQENISTNVIEQTGRLDPMPAFRLSAWDVVLPESRVLLGVALDGDQSALLLGTLQSQWRLPKVPGAQHDWQPPEQWLESYRQTVQLKVLRLPNYWGRPVLAAVATVTPVEWMPGKGPTLVPCDEYHLKAIQKSLVEVLGEPLPDTYLVVCSTTGWASQVRPSYQPAPSGMLLVHVHYQEEGWLVTPPPLDGMPARVRDFVARLVPQSVYEQRQERRNVIENYLKDHDFITRGRAEKQIEARTGRPLQGQDIERTFDQLAATGAYRRHDLDGRPSLRPATPQERAGHLAGRWWSAIAIALLLFLVAVLAVVLPTLQGFWGVVAVAGVAGMAALGQVARKLLTFLNGGVN
ncbi:MAG: CHAT domain-containing protein [Planctomycetota bacterium]